MTLLDLLMHAYYRVGDPLLVRLRKHRRLRGAQVGLPLPTLALRLQPGLAQGPGSAQALRRMLRVAGRYDMQRQGESGAAAGRRATPMMLDLAACGDVAGFHARLRAQSSRTLSKIRRAERLGYRVQPFALANHVHDVHAVKTSMRVRSGGPVLAHWLLRPAHVGHQADTPQPVPTPGCPTHWTCWWGVFQPAPGHHNGTLRTDTRLVAYVKLTRCGDIVHYLDLMGHREHLGDAVMLLMHAHIVAWLLRGDSPQAHGVRAVWYGALEHGGHGLLTWKRRAGFAPVRVRLDIPAD
ncbi:hypothetical protein [Bordetella sp. 2513F-2]